MDVVTALVTCSRTSQGLTRRADLLRAGVRPGDLTAALRAGEVVRVGRGVYARQALPPWPRFAVTTTGLERDHLLRVRAELMVLGPRAAARRRTAALLLGWGLLVEPARTVEVAVPHGADRPRRAGVDVRQVRALETEPVAALDLDPVLATTPLATAVACLTELPLLQAVVAVDSALRAGDVTVDQLAGAVAALPGTRGAAKARAALAWCDPLSGSVLESVLRVRLLEVGTDGFRTQAVIRSRRGKRLLRSDLCFEAAMLLVETDGARWHPDPHVDNDVDNQLAAAGWRVLRLTWRLVVNEPRLAVDLVREALREQTPHVSDERERPRVFSAA